MTNNANGVYFNDSTKVILEPKGKNFNYIERKGPEKQDIVHKYALSDYPKDL